MHYFPCMTTLVLMTEVFEEKRVGKALKLTQSN